MKRLIKHEDIYGMARVGYSGNYEIYVNTDDPGHIPHFHYRDKDNWSRFHTCIKIESPEYFHHGDKIDSLNSKQKRDLQNFMESKVSLSKYSDNFNNNWELICFLWEINNSSYSISEKATMPNYKNLPNK